MRWGPPPGALGAVTGAIAIGTAATSILTTTIISIRTTISTVTSTARDKGIGNITRSIAEMRRMAIGELRTSSAAMRVNSRAAVLAVVEAPAVRAELAELAAQGAREALAVPVV